MPIKLGSKVTDVITGYSGIATARVEYLTGCTQYGVSPPMAADGKIPDTVYFDEARLQAETIEQLSGSVKAAKLGGPNRDAPKR